MKRVTRDVRTKTKRLKYVIETYTVHSVLDNDSTTAIRPALTESM